MSGKVTIDIRTHRDYPATHSTAIVTTSSGYCYACTWAGAPSEAEVIEAWRTDRRAFTRYDSTTGDY